MYLNTNKEKGERTMKKIGIIYHSGYGHTKRIADTLFETLQKETGVETKIFTTEEAIANLNEFEDYTTLIFGCPTYMGGPSAQFKGFADATSKKWVNFEWKNKLAAGFTNSGSLSGDKYNTLSYLVTLACQHAMLWISLGIKPTQTKSGHGASANEINRIGSCLGLATQSDNTDPDKTPAPGDLETTKLFAKRIAKITLET